MLDTLLVTHLGGDPERPVFSGTARQGFGEGMVADRIAPLTMTGWDENEAKERGTPLRTRYRFRCPDCTTGDLPARHEKLTRCALLLYGHGESHVTTTTLRRMLSLV